MIKQLAEILNKKFPQSYILRNPFAGTLLFAVFACAFILLYRPLHIKESRLLGLELTVVAYSLIMSIPVFFVIHGLKKIPYFANRDKWSLLKELIAIFIILWAMGTLVYFAGFLLEVPSRRWNFSTYFDSCKYAFLIGVFPFAFFTLIHYRYLFVTNVEKTFILESGPTTQEQPEELIRIGSQLKKEELHFYPSQFLYAESDSNYVVFHLMINNHVQEKMIRNSISNIVVQLTPYPFIMRTHRAFIVNVKQVASQHGNSLGYRLKLNGTDETIPVSRQNTREFDLLLKQFR